MYWLGNRINRIIRFSLLEKAVWVLCLFCVSSQSFEVGLVLGLFFWIPDSLRKVLTNFETLSQSDGLVGKPDQPVHWVQFSGIEVWVLCFVCVGS